MSLIIISLGLFNNMAAMTNSNNYLSSPARTPSSENKSFDSALSSGIVSDISSTPNPSASSEYSELSSDIDSSINHSNHGRMLDQDDATPVNTIQRHHNGSDPKSLRRSVSRSSKSSSPETASTSSGNFSDRGSSSGGSGSQPYLPNGVTYEINKPKTQQQPNSAGGFDTDHHVGGTIKKRPPNSAISNPRIPLTNTTWGLVARDSDEDEISSIANSADSVSDSSSGRGGNIRVGGGGTLLRCSTALRKTSQNSNPSNNSATLSEQSRLQYIDNNKAEPPVRSFEYDQFKDGSLDVISNYSDQSSMNSNKNANIVQAQVHNNPNENSFNTTGDVDIISEEFENRLLGYGGEQQGYSNIKQSNRMVRGVSEEEEIPLPPPPRPDSVQVLSSIAVDPNQCMPLSNPDDVDDLPPPPPPEIYEQLNYQNHLNGIHKEPILQGNVQCYDQLDHVNSRQNTMKYNLPQTLPPSSIKSSSVYGTHNGRKGILSTSSGTGVKRISFDDNVQLIEETSSYSYNAPITPIKEDQQERYRFRPRQPYTCNPKKLFDDNSSDGAQQTTSTGAMLPPREFLKDLQRVMTKKWQVAEKCREGTPSNVHSSGPSTSAMLTPHQVLGFRDPVDILGHGHTYSRDGSVGAWVLQTQQFTERQLQRTEPLYAISSKQHEEQLYAQNKPLFNPSHAMKNLNPISRQNQPNSHVVSPVVLREPTPEYDPYAVPNYPNPNMCQNNRQFKAPPPLPPMRTPHPQAYDQNGPNQVYEMVGNQGLHRNGYHTNGESRPQMIPNNIGHYPTNGSANYPPHASSIGHITANSFNVGGCAYASHKKSTEKPAPPPPKRSDTTQLSTK